MNNKSLSDNLLDAALRRPNRSQLQRDSALAAGVLRLTMEVVSDFLVNRGLMTRVQADDFTIEVFREYTRRANETSQEESTNP